jgi:surface protein
MVLCLALYWIRCSVVLGINHGVEDTMALVFTSKQCPVSEVDAGVTYDSSCGFVEENEEAMKNGEIALDVSISKDNSVLLWLEKVDESYEFSSDITYYDFSTEYYYKVYVSSCSDNKKVYLSADASSLLSGGIILAYIDSSNLDVSLVENMSGMFYGCAINSLDLSSWDVSRVTNMGSMFSGATVNSDLDLSSWDVSNVSSFDYMFDADWDEYVVFSVGGSLNLSGWSLEAASKNVDDSAACHLFGGGMKIGKDLIVENWKLGSMKSLSGFFESSSIIGTLDLNSWDTSKITDFSYMFGWDWGGITSGASIGNLKISNIDTSSVDDMSKMFQNLKVGNSSLDLSKWTIKDGCNTENMFDGFGGIDESECEVILPENCEI